MWEVSVSVRWQMARQPTPVMLLTADQRRVIRAKVEALADGVGDRAAGYWHTDSVSLHFRWPLIEPEMAALPDGWLACPAVDMGGHEDRMTKEPPW